jgi:sporulation protein YlmC with PRC-barrel domain
MDRRAREAERPRVMSASTLTGDAVTNAVGEDLGRIEELMIDLENGCVAYAVLSFGGFLGLGDKLFAVPFRALTLDTERKCFVLDVPREKLEAAPGFDKHDWPDFADPTFGDEVYGYYGVATYWTEAETKHGR